MTSQGEESGRRNGQKLDDIVRDADEYYTYLKRKHVHETRLDVVVVGLVVWFASFAAIGFSALALYGRMIYYVAVAFSIAVVICAAAGLVTYLIRRKRVFKFAELAAPLSRMKVAAAFYEHELRRMGAM